MAYLAQQSSNQRMATMTAVAALHAGVLYLVVTGLAVDLIRDPPNILKTWNKPVDKKDPPPPPPKPQSEAQSKPLQRPETPLPLPPIYEYPIQQPTFGPTGGEGDFGGGGGIDLETVRPSPDPKPLFTAKAPKARGSQANWVRQSDYPSVALREEQQGLTRVKLEVSALGKVTRCTVTASSGYEALDTAACARIADRARFDPATDTSGAKTDGVFSTSVRWQLPE